jgi:outer membrane lipoprotein-sorting protein
MRYTYTIKSLTPNITLDADFFKFKPELYKGIQISDSRF